MTLRRWILALVATAACAPGNPLAQAFNVWPAVYSRTLLLQEALEHRCPFPGVPSGALRATLGPAREVTQRSPTAAVWVYRPTPTQAILTLRLEADTLVSWEVTAWRTWGEYPTLRSDLRAFLSAHPNTPPHLVWGVTHGCPQLGTSQALLEAVYGDTWDYRAVMPGPPDTLHISRRLFPRGSSNLWWRFVNDSLIDGGHAYSRLTH
jgi:hypothetical protein